MDYNSGPYVVQFNVGVTRVPFSVTLKDDSSKEDNETFTLCINSSSLPNSINIGDHIQTTVTILNDDGKFSEYGTVLNPSWLATRCDVLTNDSHYKKEDFFIVKIIEICKY